MNAFFGWLAGWLGGLLTWIIDVLKSLFGGFWDILRDGAIFLVDTVLDLVLAALASFTFDFSAFNPGTYIAALPSELTNAMALLGMPEAIAMILAALTIRFVLGLVPFVRIGA